MKRIFQRATTLFVAIALTTVSAMASTTNPKPAPSQLQTAPTAATIEANSSTAPVAETPVAMPAVATTTAVKAPTVTPTAPQLNSAGYVLLDANTGMILAHKNMHKQMQPASLTKLMSLYLTFQALKNGQIHLTDNVRVSKKAWETGGSRMFIKEGSLVSVQDLIDGIIVASGNDAVTALAQYVGGNQSTFVSMMNATAQQLGMKGTHYVDPTGLPEPGHYTTPYDIALLTRAIITNFPEYYGNFKQGWITYNGIKQPNRNRLLWRDPTVDGLKTGHTQEAGYCLVASALRHGMRLISVVMGAPTDAERASDSEALLNWGFRFYRTHKLFDANQSLAKPAVYLGKKSEIAIGLTSPLYVTIQAHTYSQLKPKVNIPNKLVAPIKKGQTVGTLNIMLNNNVIASAPLVALENDSKGNVLTRAWDHVTGIF